MSVAFNEPSFANISSFESGSLVPEKKLHKYQKRLAEIMHSKNAESSYFGSIELFVVKLK